MKAIRYVLFATALLLFASCGRQPSDIIESSPNGVTGVKMPILVTFKENVEPKEDRIREAVSISPSVDFDVYLSGMRMLRIIPRSTPRNSPDGSSKASRNSNSPRRNCGSPTATTGCSKATT